MNISTPIKGGVVDGCREHCFSCGILGYFKEQRRARPTRLGVAHHLAATKHARPVDIIPIPLYFNDDMAPDKMGQLDHRVPQRVKAQ